MTLGFVSTHALPFFRAGRPAGQARARGPRVPDASSRVSAWAAWTLGVGMGLAAPAAAASPPWAEIVTETNGVRIHVEVPAPEVREVPGTGDVSFSIPGWGTFGETGGPALPLGNLLVGVPEGAELRLEVTPGSTRFFPGARPDPVPERRIEDGPDGGVPLQTELAIKNTALYEVPTSGDLASIASAGRLRHLSVASVQIHPFRWDPAAGGVRMFESMDLVIRWDVPAERGSQSSPVNPRSDHRTWERMYSRSILNWEQAQSFLTSPAISRMNRDSDRFFAGDQPTIRITVDSTGVYRVDRESLPDEWGAADVPIDQLVLEERGFDESAEDPFLRLDVPIVVMDYDENGAFSDGDAIFFYGQSAWDRLDPEPRDKRYGRRFHYFLTTRAEGGARMSEGPSTLNRTDLTSESRFMTTARYEGDGIYMESRRSPDESAYPLTGGFQNVRAEHFYWIGVGPGTFSVIFDLPGFTRGVGLEMLFQGTLNPPTRTAAEPVQTIGPAGNEVELPPVVVPIKETVQYVQGDSVVSRLPLVETGNRWKIFLPETAYGCALDYMIWTYERDYGSYRNFIRFPMPEAAGPRQFDLTDFTSPDILAFDVTDPLRPVHLPIAAGQVTTAQRRSTARLQLESEGGAPRELVVLEGSSALTPAALAATSPRDLTTDSELAGPLDLIILTHPSFWTETGDNPVQRLAERRRQGGLRVGIVTTDEVFDQFGGGRDWPVSIRNYLRFKFRSDDVDPTYLLLVGDGSEDLPQALDGSAPNFVPTPMLFAPAFSSQSFELVPSDPWYVANLTGTGPEIDFFLDMHVGRLPIGNMEQLEAVVGKILDYEEYRDSDVWRNRGLVMADDEFSSQISFDPNSYSFRGDTNRSNPRGGESVFRFAGRETSRIIHDEAGFVDFGVDSFYVGCYLDTVACLDRCIPIDSSPPDCRDWECPTNGGCDITAITRTFINEEESRDYAEGPAQLPQKLRAAMSRGHLFVMFQAHANWALATHEYVWRDQPFVDRNDSQHLENVGKPFLFFGFGCHMNEFESYREGLAARGDCMTEKMLFLKDGRGAVAACASTGYEWLGANSYYHTALLRSWFLNPPVDSEGRSQWVLGELIDGGKVEMLGTPGGSDAQGMVLTYVLLGDPSMPVDLAPPRVDRVEVDGAVWSEGDPLIAPTDSDSAAIAVWLRDEVWIRTITVTENGAVVDPSRYQIETDPQHPDDERFKILRYRAGLDVPEEDYTIVVAGTDRVGRTREVQFPVSLNAKFEIRTGEDWRVLQAGDFVQPRDSIRVSIASPVDLQAADLELELSGTPLTVRSRSTDDREWILEAEIPSSITEGEKVLAVLVAQQKVGGTARRELELNGAGQSTDAQLLSHFAFPNPFEEEMRFFYTLNAPASQARVTVFTLRGQKIFSLSGAARSGENAILWNGRDQDGDPVSNGVYFYKLEIDVPGGRKITKTDRLARVR